MSYIIALGEQDPKTKLFEPRMYYKIQNPSVLSLTSNAGDAYVFDSYQKAQNVVNGDERLRDARILPR